MHYWKMLAIAFALLTGGVLAGHPNDLRKGHPNELLSVSGHPNGEGHPNGTLAGHPNGDQSSRVSMAGHPNDRR